MTVRDLIETLKEFCEDDVVLIFDLGEGGAVPVTQVSDYGDNAIVLWPADKPGEPI